MSEKNSPKPGQWKKLDPRPEIPEDDHEFEAFFNPVMDQENCEDLSEINPSRSGWKIRLHFDDIDPRKEENTQAHKDYQTLLSLEKVGFLVIEFEGKTPFLVVVLKHQDDTGINEFDADQMALFKRYRPIAKAPHSVRHSAYETQRPPSPESAPCEEKEQFSDRLTPVVPIPGSIDQTVREQRENIGKLGLPEEFEVRTDPAFRHPENRQMYLLEFSSLILSFPYDQQNQDAIRAKLREICDDEDLVLDILPDDETQYFDIVIEKKEGQEYSGRKMKLTNVKFFHKLMRRVDGVIM